MFLILFPQYFFSIVTYIVFGILSSVSLGIFPGVLQELLSGFCSEDFPEMLPGFHHFQKSFQDISKYSAQVRFQVFFRIVTVFTRFVSKFWGSLWEELWIEF